MNYELKHFGVKVFGVDVYDNQIVFELNADYREQDIFWLKNNIPLVCGEDAECLIKTEIHKRGIAFVIKGKIQTLFNANHNYFTKYKYCLIAEGYIPQPIEYFISNLKTNS